MGDLLRGGPPFVLVGLVAISLFVAPGVQAADTDVPGWEAARWGMTEADLRSAFRSRTLIETSRAKQPNMKSLGMPGYVFLGCPFDVTLYMAEGRGLVRIELTQVEGLSGHSGGAFEYESACNLVERKLEEMYGPGTVHAYMTDWSFPSAEITSAGAHAGQLYIDYRVRREFRNG